MPDYDSYFSQLEQQYNLPSGYLHATAGIESNMGQTPDRQGSQYQGMFQLGSAVRQQYGVQDASDWQQNAQGAAQLAAHNMGLLQSSLGRPVTGAELYLAHQQGVGGAADLLSNPNVPAGQVVGAKAVLANGGDPNAPASAFSNIWLDKYAGKSAGGGVRSGMSTYSPSVQSPNQLLANAPDWVKATVAGGTTPQGQSTLQSMASAIRPQDNSYPVQQPNLLQQTLNTTNQLSMARQQSIQQRAQQLMQSILAGKALS